MLRYRNGAGPCRQAWWGPIKFHSPYRRAFATWSDISDAGILCTNAPTEYARLRAMDSLVLF